MRVLLPFGLAFERGRDGFQGGPVFLVEDVAERAAALAVPVLNELQAGDAGDPASWRRGPGTGAVSMETASMSNPLVLTVRNSCSITQRLR